MRWLVTTSDYRGDRLRNYTEWLAAARIEPAILDARRPEPGEAAACAALLLTGGGDVDPALYGAPPHRRTAAVRRDRDRMEVDWIRRFREAGKPVLGICRGLQIVWVASGGTLIQHIPDVVEPADEAHGTGDEDDAHGVRWLAGTRLAEACGSATAVNSHHHQAADPTRPAGGLRIAATSPAGLVEALESVAGPPISAVQWHPERMHLADPRNPASNALLRHWIALARASA